MKEDKAIRKLTLSILRETFAICRLDKDAPIPNWALMGNLFSITRSKDELSIVCPQINVPKDILCNKGWCCLKVKGPLDLTLTGIISSIAETLDKEGISIFLISTYDTDYIMVQEKDLERAVFLLAESGQQVSWEQDE